MKDIQIDFQPARDLAQAEHEAADNLTQAERDDAARQAAVTAGTRQPPGPNERPYLELGRGRAATHEANSAKITSQVTTVIECQAADAAAGDAMEGLDGEADPLELRFWNQWKALPDPDGLGRKLFYPNSVRSDYGNPSYDRNRDWWDRAAVRFRTEGLVLPPEIVAFREQVLSMADRYGPALDSYRRTTQAKLESWKELTEISRQARKTRRITRSRLSDDFDGVASWVNALIAPLAEPRRSTPGGTAGPSSGGSSPPS
jgi:hypothetical protein